MRFIGGGAANTLTINHVAGTASGSGRMTVFCLVNGTRQFSISVNGAAPITVSCTGTSFRTPVASPPSVTIHLNSGTANTIKFFNNAAFAPDLDRITIR